MVINPYQGKENSSMAQPIRAGPYLSPNQPDRIPATYNPGSQAHYGSGEGVLGSQKIVGTTAAMNAVPA